jgi:hypothetical protein
MLVLRCDTSIRINTIVTTKNKPINNNTAKPIESMAVFVIAPHFEE